MRTSICSRRATRTERSRARYGARRNRRAGHNAGVPAPPHDATGAAPDRGAAGDVTLDGTIERFVFRGADDSSFTVARLQTDATTLVTIVGELVGVNEGLPLRLRGRWVDDKKFGRQFR